MLSGISQATGSSIDPQANQILKKMCNYLGNLQQFSLHTQNTLKDVLDSGNRVDYDVSAKVVVSRSNKLRAERKGDLTDQVFFYDGKKLTLYNPSDKVYATEPAPGTIEAMLDSARESLGLLVPVADLVYRNAYTLLMQDVTLAMVVGKSVIDGVTCDHLLFSRPGVPANAGVTACADTPQGGVHLCPRLPQPFRRCRLCNAEFWHFFGRIGVPVIYTWPSG